MQFLSEVMSLSYPVLQYSCDSLNIVFCRMRSYTWTLMRVVYVGPTPGIVIHPMQTITAAWKGDTGKVLELLEELQQLLCPALTSPIIQLVPCNGPMADRTVVELSTKTSFGDVRSGSSMQGILSTCCTGHLNCASDHLYCLMFTFPTLQT